MSHLILLKRLPEISNFHTPLAETDAKALVARSEDKGKMWVERRLWSYRLWSWALSLDHDPKTCRFCGATFEPPRVDAIYCSAKCRVSAHRHKENSPLTQLVKKAEEELASLKRDIESSKRWVRRQDAPPIYDFSFQNLPTGLEVS
jgi:ferredoxin